MARIQAFEPAELRSRQGRPHLLFIHRTAGPGQSAKGLAYARDASLGDHEIAQPTAAASGHCIDSMTQLFTIAGHNRRFGQDGNREEILAGSRPALVCRSLAALFDPSLTAEPAPDPEQVQRRELD